MKIILQTIFRLIVTVPVFLIFGIVGLIKLWRFGGGITVNFGREISAPEALAILQDKITEYEMSQKLK